MTIASRGLKIKVMPQANAVGLTSIEGSFFLVLYVTVVCNIFDSAHIGIILMYRCVRVRVHWPFIRDNLCELIGE